MIPGPVGGAAGSGNPLQGGGGGQPPGQPHQTPPPTIAFPASQSGPQSDQLSNRILSEHADPSVKAILDSDRRGSPNGTLQEPIESGLGSTRHRTPGSAAPLGPGPPRHGRDPTPPPDVFDRRAARRSEQLKMTSKSRSILLWRPTFLHFSGRGAGPEHLKMTPKSC